MKLFYTIIFLSAILHAAPGKLQAAAEGPRKLGDMTMGMAMSKSNQPLLLSLAGSPSLILDSHTGYL
jgi:hypothetical protein